MSEAGEITNLGGLTQGIGLDVRPFLRRHAGCICGRTGRRLRRQARPRPLLQHHAEPEADRRRSTPTSARPKSTRGRSTCRASRCCFPRSDRSSSKAPASSVSPAPGPRPPGGIPATGADVFPFFSRQIGLLGGQEVPIDAGVKLTGTVGRTDVGVLDVRTGDLRDGDQSSSTTKNFFVGRVKRNLFRQSYVGAIFTDGNPAQRQVRPDLRRRHAPGDVALSGPAAQPRRQRVRRQERQRGVDRATTGRTASRRTIRTTSSSRRWCCARFRRISSRRSASCSATTCGCSGSPAATIRGRRSFLNIQQMNHDVFYTRFTRLDNDQVESWDLYVTWWDWHFKSGDNIHGILDFNPTYERLFEPFEISPGVDPAAGRVPVHALQEQSVLDGRRSAAFRQRQRHVGATTGRAQAEQVTTSITYKLPPQLHDQPEHEPDVRPPAGRRLHRADLHVEHQLRRVAVGCRSRT